MRAPFYVDEKDCRKVYLGLVFNAQSFLNVLIHEF